MKKFLSKIVMVFLVCFKITHAIIGGKNAYESRYRYAVSLRKFNLHFCSGSIIDKFHIITAAHCIEGEFRHHIMIVAGSPYRRSLNGDYYFVQNMMRHGKHTDHWNDVALIRVTREIHIYDKVQVVALPITNVPRVDDVVALAGWGVIDPIYAWEPRVLNEIYQRNMNIHLCKLHYPVWTDHICLYSKLGEGTCKGDSGGPIIIPGVAGKSDTLVGVISGSIDPCGTYPGFHPKVYSYLSWIQETKEKLKQYDPSLLHP